MGERISCGVDFPAVEEEVLLILRGFDGVIMTERSPEVGFFMPTGIPAPLAIMRWSWSSTERAPIAP